MTNGFTVSSTRSSIPPTQSFTHPEKAPLFAGILGRSSYCCFHYACRNFGKLRVLFFFDRWCFFSQTNFPKPSVPLSSQSYPVAYLRLRYKKKKLSFRKKQQPLFSKVGCDKHTGSENSNKPTPHLADFSAALRLPYS